MKIESNKFINIQKIVQYLGTDLASKLPQIYAATGRDTTSFLNVVAKIKILKKCLNEKRRLRILNKLGASSKVSDTAVTDIEKFIQTIRYSGKEEDVLLKQGCPIVELYEPVSLSERNSVIYSAFICNPQNCNWFTGWRINFFRFLTNPKYCNRKINVYFAVSFSSKIRPISNISSR